MAGWLESLPHRLELQPFPDLLFEPAVTALFLGRRFHLFSCPCRGGYRSLSAITQSAERMGSMVPGRFGGLESPPHKSSHASPAATCGAGFPACVFQPAFPASTFHLRFPACVFQLLLSTCVFRRCLHAAVSSESVQLIQIVLQSHFPEQYFCFVEVALGVYAI